MFYPDDHIEAEFEDKSTAYYVGLIRGVALGTIVLSIFFGIVLIAGVLP